VCWVVLMLVVLITHIISLSVFCIVSSRVTSHLQTGSEQMPRNLKLVMAGVTVFAAYYAAIPFVADWWMDRQDRKLFRAYHTNPDKYIPGFAKWNAKQQAQLARDPEAIDRAAARKE